MLHAVLNDLERDGVSVLSGWVKGTELESLRGEFMQIIKDEETAPRFLRKGQSRVARLNGGLSRYANSERFFNADLVAAIAKEYFAPFAFSLNQEVYLTHDVNAQEFNSGWHVDPGRCLKFMLYLTDCDASNGAMMYAKGSQKAGIYRILYHRSRGEHAFPNFFPDSEVIGDPVSLDGPAGTLLIFEASGQHKGGELPPGGERKVIRGHCYCKPPVFARWRDRLLRSPLNIARYGIEDEHINPRFKSKAFIR